MKENRIKLKGTNNKGASREFHVLSYAVSGDYHNFHCRQIIDEHDFHFFLKFTRNGISPRNKQSKTSFIIDAYFF